MIFLAILYFIESLLFVVLGDLFYFYSIELIKCEFVSEYSYNQFFGLFGIAQRLASCDLRFCQENHHRPIMKREKQPIKNSSSFNIKFREISVVYIKLVDITINNR